MPCKCQYNKVYKLKDKFVCYFCFTDKTKENYHKNNFL